MDRIMVVGTSCSGKTTLARSIAESMGIPHVELDALYWGPNWTTRSIHEFREAVADRIRAERWVVDGNYSKVRDMVLARATDVIWLNYAFPIVFGRAILRTSRRIVSREELYGGNRETFRDALLNRDGIPWWVMRTYCRNRRDYRKLFRTGRESGIRLTELRRPAEAAQLLRSITGCG